MVFVIHVVWGEEGLKFVQSVRIVNGPFTVKVFKKTFLVFFHFKNEDI